MTRRRSAGVSGSDRDATRAFSSTCSIVLIPDRAESTCGLLSTKRRAISGTLLASGSSLDRASQRVSASLAGSSLGRFAFSLYGSYHLDRTQWTGFLSTSYRITPAWKIVYRGTRQNVSGYAFSDYEVGVSRLIGYRSRMSRPPMWKAIGNRAKSPRMVRVAASPRLGAVGS